MKLKMDEGLDHIRRSLLQTHEEFNEFLMHYGDLYLNRDVPRPENRPEFKGWKPYPEFLPTLSQHFDKIPYHHITLRLMENKIVEFYTKGTNEFDDILKLQEILPIICSDIINSEELHQMQVNYFGQVLDTSKEINHESMNFTEMLDDGEKIWDRTKKRFRDYGVPKNENFEEWIDHDLAIIGLTPGTTKNLIYEYYQTSPQVEYMRTHSPILCDNHYVQTLSAVATLKQNYSTIKNSGAIPHEWIAEYESHRISLMNLSVRMLSSNTKFSLSRKKQPLYKHFGFKTQNTAQYIQSRWGIEKIQGNQVIYKENFAKWWKMYDNYKILRQNPKKWVGILYGWHTSKSKAQKMKK